MLHNLTKKYSKQSMHSKTFKYLKLSTLWVSKMLKIIAFKKVLKILTLLNSNIVENCSSSENLTYACYGSLEKLLFFEISIPPLHRENF